MITETLETHIAAVRRWEKQVHALVEWDESAARRRLQSARSGPLKGWAIGVKDIIDVSGLPTRCNAAFIPPRTASQNAPIVDGLLRLGGFVLCKTVTTTFAYFDPGPTRNPWNLDHTPGGSSSGSAAAVACGMVRLALGSQTVASVNRPASYCGIVGFKPTYGRLPTADIFPFSPSVDTVGFFSTDVVDMQTAFAALVDEPIPRPSSPLRIGLMEDFYVAPAEEEMLAALRATGENLKAAGFDVGLPKLPPISAEAYSHHSSLIAAECASSHKEFFASYGKFYPPKLRELILHGQKVPTQELQRIEAHREQLRLEITKLFNDFDCLLTPSASGPAPVGITTTGDPRFSLIWTYTGCPTVTVPAMLSKKGLPLGLQLVGAPTRDTALLESALRVEKVLNFTDQREHKFGPQ